MPSRIDFQIIRTLSIIIVAQSEVDFLGEVRKPHTFVNAEFTQNLLCLFLCFLHRASLNRNVNVQSIWHDANLTLYIAVGQDQSSKFLRENLSSMR